MLMLPTAIIILKPIAMGKINDLLQCHSIDRMIFTYIQLDISLSKAILYNNFLCNWYSVWNQNQVYEKIYSFIVDSFFDRDQLSD